MKPSLKPSLLKKPSLRQKKPPYASNPLSLDSSIETESSSEPRFTGPTALKHAHVKDFMRHFLGSRKRIEKHRPPALELGDAPPKHPQTGAHVGGEHARLVAKAFLELPTPPPTRESRRTSIAKARAELDSSSVLRATLGGVRVQLPEPEPVTRAPAPRAADSARSPAERLRDARKTLEEKARDTFEGRATTWRLPPGPEAA
eukprot:CAMPEP_0119265670 /NCGR_PEP_ID=MMETSP1329-20130426/4414_1 /TAXON_ID=114041 /ORGANISM="Genus nov. species nov., Strain RCC1024" /LENGTH=201 /DNA_ID=CAMNT_0007265509 /DNA_START=165 /DNA_END=767 /DNA_ORIENTATION=+